MHQLFNSVTFLGYAFKQKKSLRKWKEYLCRFKKKNFSKNHINLGVIFLKSRSWEHGMQSLLHNSQPETAAKFSFNSVSATQQALWIWSLSGSYGGKYLVRPLKEIYSSIVFRLRVISTSLLLLHYFFCYYATSFNPIWLHVTSSTYFSVRKGDAYISQLVYSSNSCGTDFFHSFGISRSSSKVK